MRFGPDLLLAVYENIYFLVVEAIASCDERRIVCWELVPPNEVFVLFTFNCHVVVTTDRLACLDVLEARHRKGLSYFASPL